MVWKKANGASREVQARKQPSSTVSALVPALRSCLGLSPAIDYNLSVKQILHQVALVVVCVTATEAPSFTTVLPPLTDPPGYPCPFKFANTGGLLGSGVKKTATATCFHWHNSVSVLGVVVVQNRTSPGFSCLDLAYVGEARLLLD